MTALFSQGQTNIVSISGGKDSLATALLALETQPFDSVHLVHADTGHEHPLTVDYIQYLEMALDKDIKILRADFTNDFARKRAYILEKWPQDGVPDEVVQAAADMLSETTGIPFLDLCLWKGRFPSRRSQFCTTELKTNLLTEYQFGFAEEGSWAWSWQGVRADESTNRLYLPEFEDLGGNCAIFRPVLKWKAADVFEAAALKGILPNPLYKMGMNRVGCMPCINSSKGEIAEVAVRFPWVVEKIRKWERMVHKASKSGYATLFHRPAPKGMDYKKMTRKEIYDFLCIDSTVDWAKTSHGTTQFDIFAASERPVCSSSYGLCE